MGGQDLGTFRGFEASDLVHGFEGSLPLHAAAQLKLPFEGLMELLEAHPPAWSTLDLDLLPTRDETISSIIDRVTGRTHSVMLERLAEVDLVKNYRKLCALVDSEAVDAVVAEKDA